MFAGRSRAFTLIEALVAVVLAGIGVVAAVSAFSSLARSQAGANEQERMVRLATEKFKELSAVGELTNVGGTFEDRGEDRYVWEAQVDTTGVENVSQLTVTVSLSDAVGREGSEVVYGAVYEEPASTTTEGTSP